MATKALKTLNRETKLIENYQKQCSEVLELVDIRGLSKKLKNSQSKLETSRDILIEMEDHDNEYEKCEDLVDTIIDLLTRLEFKEESHIHKDSKLGIKNNNTISHAKLPKLQLQPFDGNLEGWLSFKDIFNSAIGQNQEVPNIEKLQHLKSLLRGDAARLVASFPITENNFDEAWQTLSNRYDNKRELINKQVSKLIKLDKITQESYANIIGLVDEYNQIIRTIKILGYDVDRLADAIVVNIIQDKLDRYTRKAWELTIKTTSIPTTNQLISFLESHAKSLHNAGFNQGHSASDHHNKLRTSQAHAKGSKMANENINIYNAVIGDTNKCLCNDNHPIFRCQTFLDMSPTMRLEEVKSRQLCLNCLRPNHEFRECKSTYGCRHCKKKHNTLLHLENSVRNNTEQYNQNLTHPRATISNPSCLVTNDQQFTNVLLSTALIKVKDCKGRYQMCRALIDSGSQANFISEACIHRLGLTATGEKIPICGISGAITTSAHGSAQLQATTHFKSSINLGFEALILEQLTNEAPSCQVPNSRFAHLDGLNIADPYYYETSPVDILLGAELSFSLVTGNSINGCLGEPRAISSKLGWLVYGPIRSEQSRATAIRRQVSSNLVQTNINEVIQKFWELEAVPQNNLLTPEERSCELHFKNTHARDETGRYTVALPFKADKRLGESKSTALKRFKQQERHLIQNPQKYQLYKEFIQEYYDLGHMSPVSNEEMAKDNFYLPHHAVIKETSSTTKLRVVFDASAKSISGQSLNDTLMVGPKIQQDLYFLLIRFRTHPVAFTADIAKMYRQIKVREEDTQFQRILWRDSQDKPIQSFKLTTVTYGTACAPFLAVKTLQQLADDEAIKYPGISKIIKEDFYVDDLLSGAETPAEATTIIEQISTSLRAGGFELRKWASNQEYILRSIPRSSRASSSSDTSEGPIASLPKVLGIIWNPKSDTFCFNVQTSSSTTHTKRAILSQVAQIFDPLGWFAPVVIAFKILMQEIWKAKVEWDCEVPVELRTTWTTLQARLSQLNKIQIPRCIFPGNHLRTELHGFCDASEKAYAAVLYVRVVLNSSIVKIFLLTSKTKVAPLKTTSLPRLELCAALLLAKLYSHIIDLLGTKINQVFLWTDSRIVLDWLAGEPHKWKTFVANRVAEIQEIAPRVWHHICGKENPADCASRGISPSELINHSLWWNGPAWLSQPAFRIPQEPQGTTNQEALNKERKVTSNIATSVSVPSFIFTFSTLTKLQRITTWCLRFINNTRSRHSERSLDSLSTRELENSLFKLIKYVQQSEFRKEIQCLKMNQAISSKSKILNLNPFLDNQEILRVGGRLKNATIPFCQKHPALLPKDHHLTRLIIDHYHQKNLHAGTQLTLSAIRHRFWIPSGRSVVRQQVGRCTKCFRFKAQNISQIMGDLPSARVTPARPFLITGIDYAGPISTKISRNKSTKSYIALFICFATRAVHIELVSELTTNAFVAALRRFTSRRGNPKEIQSDNGTTFIGADKYLRKLHTTSLTQFATSQGIHWKFIPPSAPHFGGLWEAGVKAVKFHLRRTMGNALLTFEELTTVLTQIEACLNSRPLCALTEDPNDLSPLTPGHFLIGAPITSIPDGNQDSSTSVINRWQLIQRLRTHFWNRWSKDYLNRLQQRPKWLTAKPNLQAGALVLIKDDQHPPLLWSLGRVMELFPGRDNQVRVAAIKTSKGTFKRPIAKLCPLPIDVSPIDVPSRPGGCSI